MKTGPRAPDVEGGAEASRPVTARTADRGHRRQRSVAPGLDPPLPRSLPGQPGPGSGARYRRRRSPTGTESRARCGTCRRGPNDEEIDHASHRPDGVADRLRRGHGASSALYVTVTVCAPSRCAQQRRTRRRYVGTASGTGARPMRPAEPATGDHPRPVPPHDRPPNGSARDRGRQRWLFLAGPSLRPCKARRRTERSCHWMRRSERCDMGCSSDQEPHLATG